MLNGMNKYKIDQVSTNAMDVLGIEQTWIRADFLHEWY